MTTVRRCLRKRITFAVVFVVHRVVNIVHTNPNTRKVPQMLRLENEIDPKIVQPKHLKGDKILVRRKDFIFISEVSVINNTAYVYYLGNSMSIHEFDGWTKLPVVSYL